MIRLSDRLQNRTLSASINCCSLSLTQHKPQTSKNTMEHEQEKEKEEQEKKEKHEVKADDLEPKKDPQGGKIGFGPPER